MTVYRRFLPINQRRLRTERRADDESGVPEIIGTAAVFFDAANRDATEYQLWPGTYERLMSTAFDAIADDDVRALQNHDPKMLLGRSTAGTLSLSVESHGLDYRIDTPDTSVGRDTVVSLERGDMTGSSFAFAVERATWKEEESDDGVLWFRHIEAVRTYDVGPVTFPAYAGTESGVRGFRSAITQVDRRSADAEIASLRDDLQAHIREHHHEPQRRERERVLKLLTL